MARFTDASEFYLQIVDEILCSDPKEFLDREQYYRNFIAHRDPRLSDEERARLLKFINKARATHPHLNDRSSSLQFTIQVMGSTFLLRRGKRYSVGQRSNVFAPPKNFERALYFVVPARTREAVLGCLYEDFATNIVPKFGLKTARWWYRWQALLAFVHYGRRQVLYAAGFRWLVSIAEWIEKRG